MPACPQCGEENPERAKFCLECGAPITRETGWEVHHADRQVDGGSERYSNLRMLHTNCHRQHHANEDGQLPGPRERADAKA